MHTDEQAITVHDKEMAEKVSSNNNKPTVLRVAIVQPIISPTREPWLRELGKNANLDINVFTLRKFLRHRPGWGTNQSDAYATTNVPSIFIKQNWKFSSTMKPDMGGRIIPIGLIFKLLKYKPHVIIVTNATELLSALLSRVVFGASIILLAEDTPLSYSHISNKRKYIKRKLYNLANIICAHSTQTKSLLQSLKIQQSKVYFTPWAIDNKEFLENSLLADPEETRNRLQVNGTVFVTVGSLTQRKGIMNMLYAWQQANTTLKMNASLLIIGEGPERNALEAYISDNNLTNIVLAGHLSPKDIALCLRASDVFVFPTLEDVWGLVANEAMSIGLPMLCSINAGCCNDLIYEDKNGNSFDPFNTNQLAELLINYTNKHSAGALVKYGKMSQDIISKFTIENSVEKIIAIIEKTQIKP